MFNTIKIKWSSSFGLLLLLVATSIKAHADYEPGYIILNNNDTIYGSIRDRTDYKLFDKIRFRQENRKTKRYSAYDIKGYKKGIYSFESLWYKEESEFFRFAYLNRKGYGKKVFLKVLVKGELSCYAKEYVDDDNFYFDYFELFKQNGENKFQRATQGMFGLKKKRLTRYFFDCPNLVNKINNNSIKSPLDVVTYYNTFCGER